MEEVHAGTYDVDVAEVVRDGALVDSGRGGHEQDGAHVGRGLGSAAGAD